MDEDPASCKRWISRKEIKSAKIKRTKNEKSKDYFKADLKQRVLFFFIRIFRLAITAFFRFTGVTNFFIYRGFFYIDRECRNKNCSKRGGGNDVRHKKLIRT